MKNLRLGIHFSVCPLFFFLLGLSGIVDQTGSRWSSFDIPQIVERVNAAVVNIQIRDGQGNRQFGSGIVVDGHGLIVTNYHVILEAIRVGGTISVALPDGSTTSASVRGFDQPTDIALLEVDVEGQPLPSAKLGDSDRMRIGEWVIAIGSPYGLDHSVTLGIISAKNRRVPGSPLSDFLQTDAAINPGNSGGPLVNRRGEVIGISSFTAAGQGLGFAIPVNTVKDILPQLKEKGRVSRGHFSIQVADTTPFLRKRRGLTTDGGVLVVSVEFGSSAARARLRRDDIITALNGVPIRNASHFNRLIASREPGTKFRLTLFRDGRQYEVGALIEVEPGSGKK